MFTAYLAGSGGRVVFPDATSVKISCDDRRVEFLDSTGRVLAMFTQEDLSLYTSRPELLETEGPMDGMGVTLDYPTES